MLHINPTLTLESTNLVKFLCHIVYNSEKNNLHSEVFKGAPFPVIN
jgi:hypothetical protein